MKNKNELAVVRPKAPARNLPAKPRINLPAKPRLNLPAINKPKMPVQKRPLKVKPPIKWDKVYCEHEACYLYNLRENQGEMYPYYHLDKAQPFRFIHGIFRRHGIYIPSKSALDEIWTFATTYMPYDYMADILETYSDISLHISPRTYQYQIAYKGYVKECEPDLVELYCKTQFDEIRYQRMLNDVPKLSDFEPFDDYLDDYIHDLINEDESSLKTFIRVVNSSRASIDMRKAIELGVWASLMWVIRPEAKNWRIQLDSFYYCYTYGSGLFYENNFYEPSRFKKLNRPAGSCAVCHSKPDCVGHVHINMDNIKIEYSLFERDQTPYTLKSKRINPGIYLMCMNCLGKVQHRYPHCHKTDCSRKECWYHINSYRKYLV